jgi:hypothetical protein
VFGLSLKDGAAPPRGPIAMIGRRCRAALFLIAVLAAITSGCATRNVRGVNERPFAFGRDTFSYRNDLVWEYVFDDTAGKTSHRTKEVRPDYTHHCFVVARSARQFFQFARFDPASPQTDDATYRKLINQVVARDPRRDITEEQRVVIPGFTNLFQFSVGKRKLLQEECGGAWRSYLQRGHWRIIEPFSRGGQEGEARVLMQAIRNRRPPVVHLVKFPQLTINHAVLLFDVTETEKKIEFVAYDPYEVEHPVKLTFDREARQFTFGRNPYFIGGRVNVYEIYRDWMH